MKYYEFSKNWRKIKPHLSNKQFNDTLVKDFNKYTWGRWRKQFTHGMLPEEVESCDWRWNGGRRGRMPEYWKYVKHAACHWLVNKDLVLAQLVEPKRDWQIVTSDFHSLVWDGNETLFDMNFSALGIDPNEAFEMTYNEGRLLEIGQHLKVYVAEHYSVEKNRQ